MERDLDLRVAAAIAAALAAIVLVVSCGARPMVLRGAASAQRGRPAQRSPATRASPAAGASPASRTSRAARASRTSAAAAARLAVAGRTHEYPSPAPPQTVLGGWRTPVQAVQVFATTYINWTADTISQRLRALSAVSVGQARSAVSLAAAGAANDDELHRGGIANEGVVEAIAPVIGRPHEYAVVTREQTSATNTSAYQGLAPAWHLSLATVTRSSSGLWVLSGWQPEN
ncbi:MAG: hypothetical protein ACLP50_22795 [Solirubrobacteraceae bacterium]